MLEGLLRPSRNHAQANSGAKTLWVVAVAAAALLQLSLHPAFSQQPDSSMQVRYSFDLPEQSLAESLREVGHLTSTNVMFEPRLVKNLRAPALRIQATVAQAIHRLLVGTQLSAVQTAPESILIQSATDIGLNQPNSTTRSAAETQVSPLATDADEPKEGKSSSSGGFRLAQADQGTAASAATVNGLSQNAPANAGAPARLEEVVVTAQKQSERLQDVPMAITAVTGEQLMSSQAHRFEDYVGTVPGLTFVGGSFGSAGSQLVIRGITSGAISLNASVATYIDETPYILMGPIGSWTAAPNLDTFDMQRIEVLKGPQGTLYGADALAGLLKFVTNAPDPAGFAATAATGVSSVDSGGVGFGAHAMVNIPLGSAAALRLVGYQNYYPGFIDDPSRGVQDINGAHVSGGRASLLYKPNSDLSIRLTAIYQERTFGDQSNESVDSTTLAPLYGKLIQENLISQPGFTRYQNYNATINWSLGFANLLSTTSYFLFQQQFILDDSPALGPALNSFPGAPFGSAVTDSRPAHDWTQEIRLSSASANPWKWQLGGFFTTQHSSELEVIYPVSPTAHTILYGYPANIGRFPLDLSYREFAGYADLDYYFLPTFDVDVGGRYSSNKQSYTQDFTGLFGGNNAFGTTSSESVFTYSADARWHFAPDNMLYARVATGFVPGGPNDVTATTPNVPHTYSSSTTINYELGIKSRLLDGRLVMELSAFDINWHNIQVTAIINGFSSNANGGTATSRGVEWNFAYLPIPGLTLDFNGAYTNAYLTQATPPSVGGEPGDRLPSVPLWETSTSAKYEWPVLERLSGFAGADWRFSGKRYADFEPAGTVRPPMPSFNIVDLRAGVESAEKSWSLALYVRNVGNKIAINYARDVTGIWSASVYEPRTIGADFTYQF